MRHHIEDECPRCYYRVDCATMIDNNPAVPIPGDVALCINCGEVFVYADNMQMREMTDEEREEVMADPYVIDGRRIIKERGPIHSTKLPQQKRL